MAIKPESVEIRSYQVGFGDCFLLSFVYGDRDKRHVLIDFGTTELPGRAGAKASPSRYMPLVAEDIGRTCDGHLTAVVATHRHADHISGFGTDQRTGKSGLLIKALQPKVVLQPWTEDPEAKTDARAATRDSKRTPKRFVEALSDMHDIARMVTELAARPPAWMGPELRRELSFLGEDNLKNASAVRNLIAMGKARGAKAVWARHGSPSGLEALLPGVKVHVLGPPDLRQSESIRRMRSSDPDEFWHILAGPSALRRAAVLTHGRPNGHGSRRLPSGARWFQERLDRVRGSELLQIVRALDEQMNNTSLILLFEVGDKKLLFPGDAQIENWSYALKESPDANETLRMLEDVDVYKVGHHGSLNATPRKLLWEHFRKRKRRGAGRMQTLLSTLPGKHGRVRDKTEVPRATLLNALKDETRLLRTDELGFGAERPLCHRIELPIS